MMFVRGSAQRYKALARTTRFSAICMPLQWSVKAQGKNDSGVLTTSTARRTQYSMANWHASCAD
eukprot:1212727-Pleurochrysis_carterae.AAC.1